MSNAMQYPSSPIGRQNRIQVAVICFWLFCFFCTGLHGCNNGKQALHGNYISLPDNASNQVEATLELGEDGKGFWSIETDNAPFRWDIHQNKLRLHTESGGVIEGRFDNKIIQLRLPGIGEIRFKREP